MHGLNCGIGFDASTKFLGHFNNGILEGEYVYIYKNGEKNFGEIKKGARNGINVLIDINGTKKVVGYVNERIKEDYFKINADGSLEKIFKQQY